MSMFHNREFHSNENKEYICFLSVPSLSTQKNKPYPAYPRGDLADSYFKEPKQTWDGLQWILTARKKPLYSVT